MNCWEMAFVLQLLASVMCAQALEVQMLKFKGLKLETSEEITKVVASKLSKCSQMSLMRFPSSKASVISYNAKTSECLIYVGNYVKTRDSSLVKDQDWDLLINPGSIEFYWTTFLDISDPANDINDIETVSAIMAKYGNNAVCQGMDPIGALCRRDTGGVIFTQNTSSLITSTGQNLLHPCSPENGLMCQGPGCDNYKISFQCVKTTSIYRNLILYLPYDLDYSDQANNTEVSFWNASFDMTLDKNMAAMGAGSASSAHGGQGHSIYIGSVNRNRNREVWGPKLSVVVCFKIDTFSSTVIAGHENGIWKIILLDEHSSRVYVTVRNKLDWNSTEAHTFEITSNDIWATEWFQVGFTFNAETSEFLLYLDGKLTDNISYSSSVSPGSTEWPVQIGNNFNGNIDEVYIYNDILKKEDFAWLHQQLVLRPARK